MPRYVVEVSARILRFPPVCCCCGGPDPEHEYEAEHTRTTGVRVIREDTRSWRFPICERCLEWQDAVDRIPPPHDSTIYYVLSAGVCVVVGSALMFSLMVWQEEGFTWAWLVVLLLALLPLFFYRNKAAIDKRESLRAEMKAEADEVRPSRTCRRHPVEYRGWRGTVHTFSITNSIFIDAFCRANLSKLLS